MSDTTGGFEVDGPVQRGLVGVSGAHVETSRLKQGKVLFSPRLFAFQAMT